MMQFCALFLFPPFWKKLIEDPPPSLAFLLVAEKTKQAECARLIAMLKEKKSNIGLLPLCFLPPRLFRGKGRPEIPSAPNRLLRKDPNAVNSTCCCNSACTPFCLLDSHLIPRPPPTRCFFRFSLFDPSFPSAAPAPLALGCFSHLAPLVVVGAVVRVLLLLLGGAQHRLCCHSVILVSQVVHVAKRCGDLVPRRGCGNRGHGQVLHGSQIRRTEVESRAS
mmetsp:Transcript_23856/g.46863  ORF Transcript_23856/g.46863 Transcript_23856/m.46863 type:complete len:221 (-) Transcript_23856:116-778(-)